MNQTRDPPELAAPAGQSLLLRSALFWAKRGFGIFPVEPNGKRPLGRLAPHGVKSASTDPAKLGIWWEQCPEANIGLAIPEGMFVVDLDSNEAIGEWLNACGRNGDPPKTLVIKTGRGQHHYFHSSAKIGNSAGRIATVSIPAVLEATP
jgi:Bifunctional DNA primase/polymerase, N-terminal